MAIMKILKVFFLLWISCFFISHRGPGKPGPSAQEIDLFASKVSIQQTRVIARDACLPAGRKSPKQSRDCGVYPEQSEGPRRNNMLTEYLSSEIPAGELFSFAEHLFKQKDYYRAIGEYERFVFHFPGEERAKIARFKIGLCHQKMGKFEKAILDFNKLINKEAPIRNLISNRSSFEICRTYYLSENYNRALAEIDKLPKSNRSDEVPLQILYLRGWCYLKQRQWGRAGGVFKEVSGKFPGTGLAVASDTLCNYSAGAKQLPKKSPLLAGFFSIIPGGGQVYLGRSKDGIYSFALTGGTAALSNHYYRRDKKSISYLLAGLSALFYAGNVYGAVSGAELINVSRELNYLYEIEERVKDEAWPVPDTLFLGIRILYN